MKIEGLEGDMEPVFLYVSNEQEDDDCSWKHIWFVDSYGKPITFVGGGNMGIKVITDIKPKKSHWWDVFKP